MDRKGRRADGRNAGFTLVEALVALVVAGLLLPVLGQALAGAWGTARTPMEIVSAVGLIRLAAEDGSPDAIRGGRSRGFSIERSEAPILISTRPSRLAPAPGPGRKTDEPDEIRLDPSATPSNMKLSEPKNLTPSAPLTPRLRAIEVLAKSVSGRRFNFVTVRLDDAKE